VVSNIQQKSPWILHVGGKEGYLNKARTGNPIYTGVVDDYLKQMNYGTLDLRHGAAGYTKGNLFLIDDDHHKVIAAAIRGMQTGEFSYLQRMIRNGNFRPWTPSNNLPFRKFPTKWKL